MAAKTPPGFLAGGKSLIDALRFLSKTPEAWPPATTPALLFLFLSALATFAAWTWVAPEALALVHSRSADRWWASAAAWLVSTLAGLASSALGIWLSLVLTPSLSAPAMERLVQLQEAALHLPARAPIGFVAEFLCGLRAQAFAVAFATPLLAVLWLVDLVFPPALLVTLPLKFLVLAIAVAWNLFDYPLTLRGVHAGERLSFIAAHGRAALGFGLTFAGLFWIPCFGLLMLPVGVVAATRLIALLLERDPQALPGLPRPNQ